MSYLDAVSYLDALGVDAMKTATPTLDRIERLLEALNHPQKAVPMIHITGTNGKSSVARIATALLGALGLSVGTYTSPHLEDVRERIAYNGEPISEEAFGGVFDHIRPYLELVEQDSEPLTYFELLTAMFYLWASEQPVDVAVVEVGLGGRWDATNAADGSVAVITNIGLDHVEFMGNDRREIAAEKAGIIKSGATVVTAERDPEIVSIIGDVADEHDARLLVADRDYGVTENRVALGGRYLSMRTTTREYEGKFLPLHGAHQAVNAAVALQAVTSFVPMQEILDEIVTEGLAAARVPGRIETVPVENHGPVVLDVAHNPDGASALVSALAETFAFETVVFVVGVLQNKDHEGILRELARVHSSLVLTEPPNPRALSVSELSASADALGIEHVTAGSIPDAIRTALEIANPTDLVCITGSHYVIGEARTYLYA